MLSAVREFNWVDVHKQATVCLCDKENLLSLRISGDLALLNSCQSMIKYSSEMKKKKQKKNLSVSLCTAEPTKRSLDLSTFQVKFS